MTQWTVLPITEENKWLQIIKNTHNSPTNHELERKKKKRKRFFQSTWENYINYMTNLQKNLEKLAYLKVWHVPKIITTYLMPPPLPGPKTPLLWILIFHSLFKKNLWLGLDMLFGWEKKLGEWFFKFTQVLHILKGRMTIYLWNWHCKHEEVKFQTWYQILK